MFLRSNILRNTTFAFYLAQLTSLFEEVCLTHNMQQIAQDVRDTMAQFGCLQGLRDGSFPTWSGMLVSDNPSWRLWFSIFPSSSVTAESEVGDFFHLGWLLLRMVVPVICTGLKLISHRVRTKFWSPRSGVPRTRVMAGLLARVPQSDMSWIPRGMAGPISWEGGRRRKSFGESLLPSCSGDVSVSTHLWRRTCWEKQSPVPKHVV